MAGPNKSFDSIDAEGGSIANIHVPNASDDLDSFVSQNSGDIIDLAGQTFEVSSVWSPPDETTIRNGVVKLSDGSDSDIVYREDPIDLHFENITFDLNGANQTTDTGPANAGYFTLEESTFRTSDGVELRQCKFINGSARVTSPTDMIYIDGNYFNIIECEFSLGTNANIVFVSTQQMIISDIEAEGNNAIVFDGADGQLQGGNLENNDIAIHFREPGTGDWIFTGGLIVEDNRVGMRMLSALSEFNIVNVGDVQFQGNTEQALLIESGGATTGRLIVDGATFKRNGYLSSGAFEQIRATDGDRVVLRNLTATNNSTDDADHFINLGSGASDFIIDGIDALDSDFTSGTAISDGGTGTNLGTNFTT